MRRGLTLIELIIVALIMSISAAVVVPNWIRQQESIRLSSAALAVASDFRALRNHASRSSQPLSVRFDKSVLTVSPAVPEILGDTAGRVDYAIRYPGVSFPLAVEFHIDIRGDLFQTQENPENAAARVTSGYLLILLGSLSNTISLQSSTSSGPTVEDPTSPAPVADPSGSPSTSGVSATVSSPTP